MSNIISFSLWGSNPKYTIGAIKNAQLAPIVYPNFQCRFYFDNLVPSTILNRLEDLNCQLIPMNKICSDASGMFYRFKALEDSDIVLIRDTDSRFNHREKHCVDEWLNSNKLYHTIKDHIYHNCSMVMPGLMGFKKSTIDFASLINNFVSSSQKTPLRYGCDYFFFSEIWQLIKNDIFVHDSFFGKGQKINFKREESNFNLFCGESFDEKDIPNEQHREVLKNYLGIK